LADIRLEDRMDTFSHWSDLTLEQVPPAAARVVRACNEVANRKCVAHVTDLVRRAELHWYEGTGIGRKELKSDRSPMDALDGSRERVLNHLKRTAAKGKATGIVVRDEKAQIVCTDCYGSIVEVHADILRCPDGR
jgi:hypothetical protein